MGGRGSSSHLANPRGDKWSDGLGDHLAGSLKDAIGIKGKAKSIGSSVVDTNPHHSYDFKEFSQNCQRCVVAYELQRRGYNVTALPTYKGDKLPQIAYVDTKNNIYAARWRGAFKDAKTESVGVPGNNTGAEKAVMQKIEDKMRGFGNGSRAVVQILYRSGGGHVFNVENQSGRIVYVEAQVGKIKNMSETMKYVKTESVNLVRVDNLKISERSKNFVRKK